MPAFDVTAYAAKQAAKKEKAKAMRADRAKRASQLKREAADRAEARLMSQKAIGIVGQGAAAAVTKGSTEEAESVRAASPSSGSRSAARAQSTSPAAAGAVSPSVSARVLALETLVKALGERVVEAEAESERLCFDVTELRACCKRQGRLLKRVSTAGSAALSKPRAASASSAAPRLPAPGAVAATARPAVTAPKPPLPAAPTAGAATHARAVVPVAAAAAAPVVAPMAAPMAAPVSPTAAPLRERPLSAAQPHAAGGGPLEEIAEVALCPCATCGRSFREAALVRHKRVCKQLQKKRKPMKMQYVDPKANGAENLPGAYGRRNARRGRGGKEGAATAKPKPASKWKEQSSALREAMSSAREYAAEKAAKQSSSRSSVRSNARGGSSVAARPSRRARAAR